MRGSRQQTVSRRAVFRTGLQASALVAASSVLVSCTEEEPPPPDPLAKVAARARADAAAAEAIAAAVPRLAGPAGVVAEARAEQAAAVQREIDRLRPPPTGASTAPSKPKGTAPRGPAKARAALRDALRAAEREAAELVRTVPPHRAGLLGSVAAGCACLREVVA